MNVLEKYENRQQKANVREWLLMQAQLQMDYAEPKNAVVLLQLIESIFGENKTTGLMLCKAFMKTKELEKLRLRSETLLKDTLTQQQRASVYYCLSTTSQNVGEYSMAKLAYTSYRNLIAQHN